MIGTGGTGWTDALTWGNTGVNAGMDYIRWTLCNTFNPAPKSWYISIKRSPEFIAIYDKTVTVPTLNEAENTGAENGQADVRRRDGTACLGFTVHGCRPKICPYQFRLSPSPDMES